MIFEKLVTARYKGFSFELVETANETGRKTINHEFVNSDVRVIEDLGSFPRKISVKAVIHGENAILRRNTFVRLLNRPGGGLLIHPTYGARHATVDGTYKITDKDQELGQFIFDIPFAFESQFIIPTIAEAINPSAIFEKEKILKNSTYTRLGDEWTTPVTETSNAFAEDNLIEYSEEVDAKFSDIVRDSSDLNATIADTLENSPAIVRNGNSISETLNTIIDDITNFPQNDLEMLRINNLFLFFGENKESQIDAISRDQINRVLNQGLFILTIRATHLSRSYSIASSLNFETTDQLNENRKLFNDAFDEIVRLNDELISFFEKATIKDPKLEVSESTNFIQELYAIKTLTEKLFIKNEKNLYRTSGVEFDFSSAVLLNYDTTETLENKENLIILNEDQKPSFYKNNVTILTKNDINISQ